MSTALSDTITVNGREVLMSFGLLNKLNAAIAEFGDPVGAYFNADLQMRLLSIVTNKYDKKGNVVEEMDIDELSVPEARSVLDWVVAHSTDFLLNSADKSQEMLEANKDRIDRLAPLLNGSQP